MVAQRHAPASPHPRHSVLRTASVLPAIVAAALSGRGIQQQSSTTTRWQCSWATSDWRQPLMRQQQQQQNTRQHSQQQQQQQQQQQWQQQQQRGLVHTSPVPTSQPVAAVKVAEPPALAAAALPEAGAAGAPGRADPFGLVRDEIEAVTERLRRSLFTDIPALERAAEYFFRAGAEGKRLRSSIILLLASALAPAPPPLEALAVDEAPHAEHPPELRRRQQRLAEITELIHVRGWESPGRVHARPPACRTCGWPARMISGARSRPARRWPRCCTMT